LRYHLLTLPTSTVAIDISWSCNTLDSQKEHVNYLKVTPHSASISAGQSQAFSVEFKPMDAGEFQYTLHGSIPHLHSSLKQPHIVVSASSIRPLCHFEFAGGERLKVAENSSVRPQSATGKLAPLSSAPKVV
jgi:hypothetical protein